MNSPECLALSVCRFSVLIPSRVVSHTAYQTPDRFTPSGVIPISSDTETLSAFAIGSSHSIGGFDSVSHRDIRLGSTPSDLASSDWDNPKTSRRLRMLSLTPTTPSFRTIY